MHSVALIIPTLDLGGAEKQLTLLATRLPAHGFRPEVIALTRLGPYEAPLREAGIQVYCLNKRLKIDPACWYRLRSLLARQRYSLIHTWLFAGNSYGRLAAWSLRHRRVVVTERCADHWKSWLHIRMDRLLLRCTDRVVVNSRGVWAFYRDVVEVPEGKLVLIPNGMPDEPLPFVNRKEKRRQLGIPEDAAVVGFVGRLWPQKRVRDLIWAGDIVRNLRPDIRLLIVGDGPLRADLESYAHDVGMGERTVFVGERRDVPELLQIMDVLVLPSEFEGMPNVLLEAMWAGLPIVATAIPGTDEVVVEGETGFLVPVGDRAMMAKRICRLLQDPELRHRMGEAGRRRVREHFSVERMVAAHVRLYTELIEQSGSAAVLAKAMPRVADRTELATRPMPASGIRAALL